MVVRHMHSHKGDGPFGGSLISSQKRICVGNACIGVSKEKHVRHIGRQLTGSDRQHRI